MRVLREKKGASMIFVLAAMLLLMAIGVSAITAAGYNYNAGLAQSGRSQLDLYVSSMERTIHGALMEDTTGQAVISSQELSGLILRDAYLSGPGKYTGSYTFTPSLPDSLDVTYTIEVTANMDVDIYPPVPVMRADPIMGDDPLNPDGPQIVTDYVYTQVDRSPQTARISGKISVTQTTEYNAPAPVARQLRMATITTYQYSGGEIVENFSDFNDPVYDSNMFIVNAGNWTVSAHEKTEG